jgi:hypothetical protein
MFCPGFVPVSLCQIPKPTVAQAEIKEEHRRNNSKLWISRPLRPSFLNYAAYDINVLKLLLPKLKERLPMGWGDIKTESQKYAELHHDARSNRDLEWHNHGFLPQEILDPCKGAEKVKNHPSRKRQCPGCCRSLHRCSFFNSHIAHWQKQSFRRKLCFTCFSVSQSKTKAKQTPKNTPSIRKYAFTDNGNDYFYESDEFMHSENEYNNEFDIHDWY